MAVKTFNGETPETSDVVLCHYCGVSLHDPEHDVFWEQLETHPHRCVPMLEEELKGSKNG